MTSKSADASTSFLKVGKEQTDAMISMQKELADAYEQASRAWLARVKSEVDFWSELASKLTATKSPPEALEAYRDCAAQRVQMAAEDGRRLMEDCQKLTQKITQSMSMAGHPQAHENGKSVLRRLHDRRSRTGERPYSSRAPARSLVSIEDVGGATAFLAHDAARLITGETLYIDSGYHIID